MSEPMERRDALTRLTIERFRGFNDRVTLDFDASAVLLVGANGTGKTSLFDAIQWLLVGSVPRLRKQRVHRNEEFAVNRWRQRELAVVEAEWRLGGETIVARRTGTSESSSMEVVNGEHTYQDAAAALILTKLLVRGELPLEEMLLTSGLLQQDDLRALLTTKPHERYRQILRLLGLQVLERFENYSLNRLRLARKDVQARQRAVEEQREVVQSILEEVETLQSQVDSESSPSAYLEAITARLVDSEQFSSSHLPQSLEDLASIGGVARSLLDQIRRLEAFFSTLPDVMPADSSHELETVQAERRRIQEALFQAQEMEESAELALQHVASVHDLVGRLAVAALPLLDESSDQAPCPVCQSLISPRQVAAELALRSADAAALVSARAARDSAQEALAQFQAQLAEQSRIENSLLQTAGDRRTLAAGLRRALLELGSWARPVEDSILSLTPGALPPLPAISDATNDDVLILSWWIEHGPSELRTWMRDIDGELSEIALAAETAGAAAAAVRLAAERSAALPRREVRYREELEHLERLVAAEAMARRIEGDAAVLRERTQAVVTELFRERFGALAPLVNDIYARLDPHPAFKQLNFVVETYRAQGTATASVTDEERSVRANPMLVFSAAQTNVVVLALFLALAWTAGGLPFILLDDPLQAMDDVNALGMADLCRRLRRQRQLVIATHEERFGSLLERKLTGRAEGEDLIVHAFLGWTRAGPSIESRNIQPRLSDASIRVLAS